MSVPEPNEGFIAISAGNNHSLALRFEGMIPTAPADPEAPTLTRLGGGQVLVAWAENSDNEDGFEVQRQQKSGSNWVNTTIVADVGANVTSIIDLPGSGTLRYRVRAYNDIGASEWSAWSQIKN